jgi:hypothetical protein
MTLSEILHHSITNLPITQTKEKSFRAGLRDVLNTFYELVLTSENQNEHLAKRLDVLIKGILQTIDYYYQGKPSDAYNRLRKCLSESKTAEYLEKKGYIDMYTNLYRIRKKSSNYPMQKRDLFHIPFEQRGTVSTQRYSIPGLPSLYLSNSIYVAWEEMRRPDINEIQAVRLQNVRPLQVLDMSTDDYNRNNSKDVLDEVDIVPKLLTWPLIAACSIKVRNSAETFKPEYIISQLMLQWINKNKLDGIKYSSTHINTAEKQHEAKLYNIVIPVKDLKEDVGYCNTLLNTFNGTEVLPMQLRAFAAVTDRFHSQSSPSIHVNPDIITLELVTGKEEMYWATSFGVLEHALKGLDLGKICD